MSSSSLFEGLGGRDEGLVSTQEPFPGNNGKTRTKSGRRRASPIHTAMNGKRKLSRK